MQATQATAPAPAPPSAFAAFQRGASLHGPARVPTPVLTRQPPRTSRPPPTPEQTALHQQAAQLSLQFKRPPPHRKPPPLKVVTVKVATAPIRVVLPPTPAPPKATRPNRRESNRKSAARSRLNKKTQAEQQQASMDTLLAANTMLMDHMNELVTVNAALRAQLHAALGLEGGVAIEGAEEGDNASLEGGVRIEGGTPLKPLVQGFFDGLDAVPAPTGPSTPTPPNEGAGDEPSDEPYDDHADDQYREMQSWLEAVMQ